MPAGRMMMQMLGAFAEYERGMVKERTQAGMRATRAQGRHGGRRPKFTQAQQAEILSMLAAGRPAAEVARLFQVHRATISRLNTVSRHATSN
jgi:DNA invertase Pin-like site-specific DNA recombinase